MAKAPSKKASAKKAATKSKKAPIPTATPSPAPAQQSSKTPMLIPMMLGAILIGIVLGMTFNSGSTSMTDDQFNAKVDAYIKANAGGVIEALNNHIRDQANAEKQQALNLVKANDGKTIFGNPDGDVTIYKFSDYNCGYCKRAFNEVMNVINEDGNIRVVIKEFPILSPSSTTAAQLSMAAAELGRYEEFHVALMRYQGPLGDEAFTQIIEELGMDMTKMGQIIAEGKIDSIISENQEMAQTLQVTGTPAFIIGDQIIPGYIPKEQILELVNTARKG